MNSTVYVLACLYILLRVIVSSEDTKLIFVQILYRHGDRAPIDTYPNDPNPASVWPLGLAHLTKLGMRQHYALGKYFHERYKNFSTFSPLEVKVTSSEVNRCMKSALTSMASFFSPGPEWSFDPSFDWQPIPFHYLPKSQDKYLETDSECPRATAEQERIVASPEGQEFLKEHEVMLKNLTFLSGKPLTNWTQASYLRDALFIEKKYNLTIPPWVEPFWEELTNVSNLSFYWSFSTPLIQRLRAGPLLGQIVSRMREKINGDNPDQKFHIYSAHDTNIAVVLNALNLFNMLAPPYTSTLLFELHQMEDGEKAVRLLFLNSSRPEERISPPHLLLLEGCSEFCPLDRFVEFVQPLVPEDWEAECEMEKSFMDKVAEKQVTIGWFIGLAAAVIVLMSVYVIWRIYSRRQNKYAYHLMPMN